MNQQNDQATYGYGFADRSGPYLVRTRKAFLELVNPTTAAEMRANVTGCILHKFTELDKALFSSRQYILTLWPAFVGAIVALAPDPSIMVYDNIWWSVLFAITSGGLPGMESASPPHHVDAISEREGQALCEAWHFDPSRPQIMSKEKTMGSYTRGKGFILFEWASFFLSVVLWLYFCVRFGQTLKLALDMTFESEWLAGALWYYISASPAVIGLVLELIRNRVDLYEPANRIEGEMEASRKAEEGRIRSLVEQQHFHQVKVRSVFSLWLRVLRHQWRRSQYRILVRNHQSYRYEWLFVLGRSVVGGSRITIFTIGSITMGNIVLMPVPDDVYLFVLLLFTTGVPRQLWSAFWTNGNRGADLVVWVKTVKMMGPDGAD